MMEVWKLLLLAFEAPTWAAACVAYAIQVAIQVMRGVEEGATEKFPSRRFGCWCIV